MDSLARNNINLNWIQTYKQTKNEGFFDILFGEGLTYIKLLFDLFFTPPHQCFIYGTESWMSATEKTE